LFNRGCDLFEGWCRFARHQYVGWAVAMMCVSQPPV
jgi:hypothetical protein